MNHFRSSFARRVSSEKEISPKRLELVLVIVLGIMGPLLVAWMFLDRLCLYHRDGSRECHSIVQWEQILKAQNRQMDEMEKDLREQEEILLKIRNQSRL